MIAYPDGQEVRVGDRVLMNHGREPGVVEDIIDSPTKLDEWLTLECGLMIKCEEAGLCFWPTRSLDKDEIKFISRPAS